GPTRWPPTPGPRAPASGSWSAWPPEVSREHEEPAQTARHASDGAGPPPAPPAAAGAEPGPGRPPAGPGPRPAAAAGAGGHRRPHGRDDLRRRHLPRAAHPVGVAAGPAPPGGGQGAGPLREAPARRGPAVGPRADRGHRPAATGHGRAAPGRLSDGARPAGFREGHDRRPGRRTRRSRRPEPGRRMGRGETPPWRPALTTRAVTGEPVDLRGHPGPRGRPALTTRAVAGEGVDLRGHPGPRGRPALRTSSGARPACAPQPRVPASRGRTAGWPPGGPRPRPGGPPPPGASPDGGPWRC